MILRLWRGRARHDQAAAYRAHVTGKVFPALERIPGFVRGRLCAREWSSGFEFLVITEWASWDAIRGFAGETPDVAVVEPAARAVLADFDTHVEHFEE